MLEEDQLQFPRWKETKTTRRLTLDGARAKKTEFGIWPVCVKAVVWWDQHCLETEKVSAEETSFVTWPVCALAAMTLTQQVLPRTVMRL
jgi:hypothetical protein